MHHWWQAVDPGVAVLAVCTLQLLCDAAFTEATSAPTAPAEGEPAPSSVPASCGATRHADDCPFRPATSAAADAAPDCQASSNEEQAHFRTASALAMAEMLYGECVLRQLEFHLSVVILDQQPSPETLNMHPGAAEAFQALQAVCGVCQAALECAAAGSRAATADAAFATQPAAGCRLLPSRPLLQFVVGAAVQMLDFAAWNYKAVRDPAALEAPEAAPADRAGRLAAAAEQRKKSEQMLLLAPSCHLAAAACSLLSWLLVSEHPDIRGAASAFEGGDVNLALKLLAAMQQLTEAPGHLHDTMLICCLEGLSALSATVARGDLGQVLASQGWEAWQSVSQLLEQRLLGGAPGSGHSCASAPAQQGAAQLRRAVGARLSALAGQISQSRLPQSGTEAGDGSRQLAAPSTQSAAPATAESAAATAADAAMAELLQEEQVRSCRRSALLCLQINLMISCRASSLLRRSGSFLGVRDIPSASERVARSSLLRLYHSIQRWHTGIGFAVAVSARGLCIRTLLASWLPFTVRSFREWGWWTMNPEYCAEYGLHWGRC